MMLELIGGFFGSKKGTSYTAPVIGSAEDFIRTHTLSKEVAKRVNEWMDAPYKEKITEQEDVEQFALEITKFIASRLSE